MASHSLTANGRIKKEGKWPCPVCSFLNHKLLAYCEMCETPFSSLRDDTEAPVDEELVYGSGVGGSTGSDAVPVDSEIPESGHRQESGEAWSCPRCSFANLAELPYCEMCEEPRPAGTSTKNDVQSPPQEDAQELSESDVIQLAIERGLPPGKPLEKKIPVECLRCPYAQMREWNDTFWPYCLLCSRWSDLSHVTSSIHKKNVAKAPRPAPPVAVVAAPQAPQDISCSMCSFLNPGGRKICEICEAPLVLSSPTASGSTGSSLTTVKAKEGKAVSSPATPSSGSNAGGYASSQSKPKAAKSAAPPAKSPSAKTSRDLGAHTNGAGETPNGSSGGPVSFARDTDDGAEAKAPSKEETEEERRLLLSMGWNPDDDEEDEEGGLEPWEIEAAQEALVSRIQDQREGMREKAQKEFEAWKEKEQSEKEAAKIK